MIERIDTRGDVHLLSSGECRTCHNENEEGNIHCLGRCLVPFTFVGSIETIGRSIVQSRGQKIVESLRSLTKRDSIVLDDKSALQ